MKKPLILIILLSCAMLSKAQKNPEESTGWLLGAQAYTFRLFDFDTALKKIDSCNLRYVEGFPGQDIGGGIEGKLDFNMPKEKREQVKNLLKKHHVTIVSYGVVSPKNEEEWTQLFEFAKDMGLRNISSEPDPAHFSFLVPMAEKYQINIAIHNHPQPSHYWNPDSVLAVIGNSKYIGACADIGHWVRSGLNPIKALKKLDGRVLGLHVKDLEKKPDEKYEDVVWGNGQSQIDEVIAELKRQNFKGPIMVEYEANWDNNAPLVAQSVAYFRKAFEEKP